MSRPQIILEIGELVLHGFDPRDHRHIGDALQVELQALLAGQPRIMPRQADRIDAGEFRFEGESAQAIGRKAARSLHGSVFRCRS
jgi:hypothetical protein